MILKHEFPPTEVGDAGDHDGLPLQPDTGWGTEVRELMRERSQGFDGAFASVAIRYLAEGDLRPLKDLLGRGRVEPGETVLRYVAAMLEGSGKTPFRFGFEEARPRGRPSGAKASVNGANLVTAVLMSGLSAMIAGKKPGWRFWRCLLSALDAGTPNKWRRPNDFPLKARVFPTGKTRGRRSDPELAARDKVLAWNVRQRLDQGHGYKSAIPGTLDCLREFAREEKWRGRITAATVRNAYDRSEKATGRN